MGDQNNRRFEVLDGMRGIAAISIMFSHFLHYYGHDVLFNTSEAVDLFFILSGFVIAYSYGNRLGTSMSYKNYILKRVVRLYPMFIIALITGTVVLLEYARLGLAGIPKAAIVKSFGVNALFLPYLHSYTVIKTADAVHGDIFPADGALWSLSFEMLASIAFLLLYKQKNSVLALISAISIVLLAFLAHIYDATAPGWGTDNVLAGIPRVFYGFCLGILLYRLHRALAGRVKYKAVAGASILIYLIMLAALCCHLFIKGAYFFVVIAIIAPALVFCGSFVDTKGRYETQLAKFLGWISYPLYCLHTPIFRGLVLLNGRYHLANPYELVGLAALIAITVTAVVTKYYDEPVRNRLNRMIPTRKRTA